MGEVLSETIGAIVLQPTSLCNLNCRYCYLPNRNKRNLMAEEVAEVLAHQLYSWDLYHAVSLIWHGGEPLAAGRDHFQKLIRPFKSLAESGRIVHEIQSNCTLIDGRWCEFLKENHFRVGVSIDGPEWANTDRRRRGGGPTYAEIIRGINRLKENSIPFSVIAVVKQDTISFPESLYDFFCSLGCESLGLNFEEREGVNSDASTFRDIEVRTFWTKLFACWVRKPILKIREFERAFRYFARHDRADLKIDPFPTVAWNGDVSLLSPELAETPAGTYGTFIIGNVKQLHLRQMIATAAEIPYVSAFLNGVARCEQECDYFRFCRGGQASNKFFETGTLLTTQTQYCLNAKIRLLDSILDVIEYDNT